MTPKQHERTIALAEQVEAEKRQIAQEIIVEQFGLHDGPAISGAVLITRHGEFQSKTIRADCKPTAAVLQEMLFNAIATHARRMPKHQAYRALCQELSA
jgi:hypothetical protein